LQEQASIYQQWDIVIGRVQLHGAIRNQPPPDNPAQLPTWRGASALIEALYVSSRVTRDTERLCATLSDKYGVPCNMGYPPYTQQDWDNRARSKTLNPRDNTPWAEVGMYPPGKTAPQRFFTATVPPRQGRKPLHTWTEQT
jgi:hypothetical protein